MFFREVGMKAILSEAAKFFVVMCTIFAQEWGQNNPSHADYVGTADYAGIGEWAQLDLQSIQHKSAIFHSIKLPFDAEVAEKILNGV